MKKLLAPIFVVALLAIPASGASAATVGEIADLSGPPGQMTYGPDGNAWVLFNGAGTENLARVKPNGDVKEYDVDDLDGAVDITRGPGSTLWASVNGGVVEMKLNDPENSDLHDVDALNGGAQGITNGSDNRIFAVSNDQFVSFPANNPNNQDEDTIPNTSARGIDAVAGKIWVADFGGSDIIRVSANGENFKRFNVGGGPQQVAEGPNGVVGYTNPGSDPQTVGRIEGNAKAKKTKDNGADPFGMTFEGGSWWIGQFNKPGKVGVLSQSGSLTQFDGGLPNGAKTRYNTSGGGRVFVGIENRDEVAIIEDL